MNKNSKKLNQSQFSNSLITVIYEDGEQIVDARELHEYLEVKSKFADWIRNRISEYEFTENQDFISVSKNLENGGRSKEYHLTLEMAKELAMVERTEKGRVARQYFIQVEKQYREIETNLLKKQGNNQQQILASYQNNYFLEKTELVDKRKTLQTQVKLDKNAYENTSEYKKWVRSQLELSITNKSLNALEEKHFGRTALFLNFKNEKGGGNV